MSGGFGVNGDLRVISELTLQGGTAFFPSKEGGKKYYIEKK